MKKLRRFETAILFVLLGNIAYGQQLRLGLNPYTVEKSAVLELQSNNQGLLFPRITDTSLINALTPPDGMVIYFTPGKQLLVRSNGYWQPLTVNGVLNNYWSIGGNNNGVAKNIGNLDDYSLGFITNNVERMKISNTGSVGIGSSSFNATNPEKLLIDAGSTSSFNLVNAKGNINNYLQLNIQNQSNGTTASSDVVATADNGDETINYVDLGINSSGFTSSAYPILSGINNAYLYSTGNDFVIGNSTSGKNLVFFTGGFANANERMRINGIGNLGLGLTTPTALLHLKAGTTSANTAPLKFTSGNLMTTAEAGAVEFLTDKFYGTITTGNARKEFTLNDAALTSGRIPVVTTNGRLTSNANFVWDNTNSRLGVRATTPTAFLHLGAGTATASNAPLKFTSGTNLTTPEAGAMEFNGTHLYFTIGATRYQLDQQTGTTYTGSNGITLVGNDFRNNLITGLAGGQTVFGGTAAGNSLTLSSTSHATKGNIIFGTSVYDELNNKLGIGNSTPSEVLDVTGNLKFSGALMPSNIAGTAGYILSSNGAGNSPSWISLGLSNLSDAVISSPAIGQVLQYNGTKWANVTPSFLSSVDTTNISSFYLKVRSLQSAGTGISYNNSNGVISNSGVLSLNGNSGALTLDTTYIGNFYQKVRGLFSSASPITLTNGQIGITQASSTTSGYLSSADWNNFNNKSASFTTGNLSETGSSILTITGGTNAIIGTGLTLQVKQASTAQNGFLSSADWNTFNNKLSLVDTTNISNFYIKARSLYSAGAGISYNNTTGVIGNSGVLSLNGNSGALTLDTTYIGNFYQKVRGLFSSASPITLTNGQIGITQASSTTSGYLSSADWNNFNNKSASFTTGNLSETGSSVLTINGGTNAVIGTGLTLQVKQASTSQNGFLSSADWNTFNNKLSSIDTTNISGFSTKVRSLFSATSPIIYSNGVFAITQANTSTNGYLSNTDWNTFNNKLSSIDTTNISNFYTKVRSLFSAGSGISYNSSTGLISSTINANNFWALGGNTTGAIKNFGSSDNYSVGFITNNAERMRIDNFGRVGIGVTDPSNPLVVKDTLEIRRTGTLSQLLFTNTAGTGDFRIGGDGGDIFWQGGGARSLQMGSYWGMVLSGDRQTGTFPSFLGGINGTGVLIPAQRDASVALAIQANSATQTANLTEWRNSNGTVLDVVDETGALGVGTSTFDATNPEKLLVNAGTTSSYNLMNAKGSINNYLQINIQNQSNGTSASSDIVATANNGDESVNYVDLGMNSGGYSSTGVLGGANNAYLYSTGNDFVIGNATASKSLKFFTGGTNTTNERMRIDGSGNVGIGNTSPNSTLSVTGSQSVSYRTGSGSYTILSTDYVVINTGTGGTWTLPAANTCPGRVYKLINHGTGNMGISPAVTISNGLTSNNVSTIAGSNLYEVLSDGTVWRRIN